MASLRAMVSVVMLAGFMFVAFVQLALVMLLNYWLAQFLPGQLPIVLTLPLYIVAIGSVVGALWSAVRKGHEPLPGVVVQPHQAGPLWTMVRELADASVTRMPDEIRVVATVNASVSEATRLSGLLPGKRYLYLGLPLLQSLSAQQIRAVIAHELGHYSHAHTRLGDVAYRGRQAISGTVSRIDRLDPLGLAFRAYYLLYLRADHSVSRLQELQADVHAVRAAGKIATISAITEVNVLAAACNHFVDTQISTRAEHGFMPDDLYAGLSAFLNERQADLAKLRQVVWQSTGSWRETHPPVSERIFEIERLPDEQVANDDRPGYALVGGLDAIARLLTPHAVSHANCEVLPWPDFIAAAATAQLRAQATRAGGELAEVIRLVAQGRSELVKELPPLLGLAALSSGAARWQPSWTGPTALVGLDGEPLPLAELARLARRPGGTDLLAKRLRELGIEVQEAVPAQRDEPSMRGVRLLGGLANMRTSLGKFSPEADVLILNLGLILIETTRDRNEGTKRLESIVAASSLEETARRHRFVPAEAISYAEVSRPVPLRAQITLRDGDVITLRESWMGEELTDQSRQALLDLLLGYPEKRS